MPPVAVRPGSSIARAMPKSASFTRPSGSTMMLLGLTSRCTMPAACAASSALSVCRPMFATSSSVRLLRAMTSDSVGASTSSMTRYVTPCSTMTS
ncbi:hypothetical protein SAMN04488000_106361 [Lentzea albida]|uniref:Uncharacterized protein n=1 Tax=Lentzea albida TaxID=65499 RepID=A0A1H9M023_9PSEU|nr:hypothetical protein SAMN04488000_106361 [Lentzea albida]